jgi:hypothetical protein
VTAALLLSAATLSLNIFGFYLLSHSLAGVGPTLIEHVRIVPPALISGVVPLPMDALGALDLALNYLYQTFSAESGANGRGLAVAMVHRVVGFSVACLGAGSILTSRRSGDAP